jgi:hypothetical protein
MAFNPPIPPPIKNFKMKIRSGKYNFNDSELEHDCMAQFKSLSVGKKRKSPIQFDFHSELKKVKICKN